MHLHRKSITICCRSDFIHGSHLPMLLPFSTSLTLSFSVYQALDIRRRGQPSQACCDRDNQTRERSARQRPAVISKNRNVRGCEVEAFGLWAFWLSVREFDRRLWACFGSSWHKLNSPVFYVGRTNLPWTRKWCIDEEQDVKSKSSSCSQLIPHTQLCAALPQLLLMMVCLNCCLDISCVSMLFSEVVGNFAPNLHRTHDFLFLRAWVLYP